MLKGIRGWWIRCERVQNHFPAVLEPGGLNAELENHKSKRLDDSLGMFVRGCKR